MASIEAIIFGVMFFFLFRKIDVGCEGSTDLYVQTKF